MAPHRHLVVAVTNISARVGALLIPPGSLALGAQHGKLDAGLRTIALLSTPSVLSVHDYYPFALEDGGKLPALAGELVDRLAILVAVRRFPGMGAASSRNLVLCAMAFITVCNISLDYLCSFSAFWAFGGYVRREFMQRLSVALHGTLGSYPRDALQEGSADAVACLPVPRA
jgi:hypothetical protein